MVKRSVILTLQLPKGHEDGILALLVNLCDHVEKWRDAGLIEDYGLGLVVPQLPIKELPTDVIHVDEDPKVLRDTRDKILEQSDRR